MQGPLAPPQLGDVGHERRGSGADQTFRLDSPAGGTTVLEVRLPDGW